MTTETMFIKRLSIFVYGVVCYTASLATLLYTVGFLADLWVPTSLDSARAAPLASALPIDVALLMLFALQHSVMARPRFKPGGSASCPNPLNAAPTCCSRAWHSSRCSSYGSRSVE